MLTPKELARFWLRVDARGPDECWPCLGYRTKWGYAQFYLRGRVELAHRVAYLIEHGHWPTPCGLHSCDNPLCCNPAHISEGTIADNNAQMMARGRHRSARGDRHGSRMHPERVPRGDAHGSRTHPESVPRKFSDETIAAVRVAIGTQEEIAARWGMSQSHVSNIKRGEQRHYISGSRRVRSMA